MVFNIFERSLLCSLRQNTVQTVILWNITL